MSGFKFGSSSQNHPFYKLNFHIYIHLWLFVEIFFHIWIICSANVSNKWKTPLCSSISIFLTMIDLSLSTLGGLFCVYMFPFLSWFFCLNPCFVWKCFHLTQVDFALLHTIVSQNDRTLPSSPFIWCNNQRHLL